MGANRPKKILVVGENRNQALLIQGFLEPWAKEQGTKIEFAASAGEALQKLSTSRFEFVLTDYHLSDQTAPDFLHEMKTRDFNLPVLLITSAGDELLAVNALQSGFADFVVSSGNSLNELPNMIEGVYQSYLNEEREGKLRPALMESGGQSELVNQKEQAPSHRDELTGLVNHRFLHEKMAEEFARASHYHYPLSCLMIDIDHFKTLNDSHGYRSGDDVLKQLGNFLTSHLRQADTVARYGGEEFVVLLPHVGYEGADLLAERLRKKLADQTFEARSGSALKISVSVGVSSYPEDPVDRKDTLIFYAEKALMRAKGKGRHQVCTYRDITKDYADQIPILKLNGEKVYQFRQRLFDVSEMAKRVYIEATKALINALEAKDPHTMGHAARVGHYSALVAQEMGLGEDNVRIIEHAGLLHDVGKICISDHILLKPSIYNHEEYEKMKAHPVLGYQIVKPIKFLAEEALIILHHHEWYNGEGYPHRLKGKDIPLGARVVSVLDAYDTMRAAGGRYKRTLNCEEAIRELINHSGTQFDPDVVSAFVRILLKKGDLHHDSYDRGKLEQSVKVMAA